MQLLGSSTRDRRLLGGQSLRPPAGVMPISSQNRIQTDRRKSGKRVNRMGTALAATLFFLVVPSAAGHAEPNYDIVYVGARTIDPETALDAKATWGEAARYSDGFRYVMVNDVLVVDAGVLVNGMMPGLPAHSGAKR